MVKNKSPTFFSTSFRPCAEGFPGRLCSTFGILSRFTTMMYTGVAEGPYLGILTSLSATLHAIYSPMDSIAQSGLQAPRDPSHDVDMSCMWLFRRLGSAKYPRPWYRS